MQTTLTLSKRLAGPILRNPRQAPICLLGYWLEEELGRKNGVFRINKINKANVDSVEKTVLLEDVVSEDASISLAPDQTPQ